MHFKHYSLLFINYIIRYLHYSHFLFFQIALLLLLKRKDPETFGNSKVIKL